MSRVLSFVIFMALVLAATGTSYGLVIGDFEGNLGNWKITWEGATKPSLAIGLSDIGATSGKRSLMVTSQKNGFAWPVMYEGLVDLSKYKAISADVTWVASEWAGSGIWVQCQLLAINSNAPSGWQQYTPNDPVNPQYPGSWDPVNWGNQTRTLTWDISKYDATGATWMQIILSTNMGNVTTMGNFYIDNVRLLGDASEPIAAPGFTDNFDAVHNYLTGGLGAYAGILNPETIQVLDANTASPGALYMKTANSVWDPGPGALLYVNVTGDFVATVKVKDFAGTLAAIVEHNDAGLLARDPNNAKGENWVSMNYFPTWTAFVARNTVSGTRNELGQTAGTWTGADTFALVAQYPYIQLERKGADFYFRISADGVSFIPLTDPAYLGIYDGTQKPLVVSRPDLPATLQVGLMSATYTPNAGYVAFEDFSIALPTPAIAVPLVNASFELPGTVKIKGWNGEGIGGTPAVDIPGWASDTAVADSGVETGYTPTDGAWTAFLMGADPSVWQSTGFVIFDDDTFELRVDARNTWQGTTLRMTLYYDEGGVRVPAASADVTVKDTMQTFTLSFAAKDMPACVGKVLGVEFDNVTTNGESWIGLDNVRLNWK